MIPQNLYIFKPPLSDTRKVTIIAALYTGLGIYVNQYNNWNIVCNLYPMLFRFPVQGNYVGMNQEEIESASMEDYERRLQRSYDILGRAGSHYVIDTINDLPTVLDDINRRLANGEHP